MPSTTRYQALARACRSALDAPVVRVEALLTGRFPTGVNPGGARMSIVPDPACDAGTIRPFGKAPSSSHREHRRVATVVLSAILAVAILPLASAGAALATDRAAAPPAPRTSVTAFPANPVNPQARLGRPVILPVRRGPTLRLPRPSFDATNRRLAGPWNPPMSPGIVAARRPLPPPVRIVPPVPLTTTPRLASHDASLHVSWGPR